MNDSLISYAPQKSAYPSPETELNCEDKMTKNRHAQILRRLAEDIRQKRDRIENLAAQGLHKIKRGRRNVDRQLKQIDDGSKLMAEAIFKKRILEEPLPDLLCRIAKEIESGR